VHSYRTAFGLDRVGSGLGSCPSQNSWAGWGLLDIGLDREIWTLVADRPTAGSAGRHPNVTDFRPKPV